MAGAYLESDIDQSRRDVVAKGGTVKYTQGNCIAYGWIYRNRKADNTLPVSGPTPTMTACSQRMVWAFVTRVRMTGGVPAYHCATVPPSTTARYGSGRVAGRRQQHDRLPDYGVLRRWPGLVVFGRQLRICVWGVNGT